MRLSYFIRDYHEFLGEQWAELMIASSPVDLTTQTDVLRGLIRDVLLWIADTIDRAIPPVDGSDGRADASAQYTPAWRYGAARHASGTSGAQIVAEFRALRVIVISAHARGIPAMDEGDSEQLRFHQSVDQAIAEAMSACISRTEQHDILSIFAHDLRSPLNAINMASSAIAIKEAHTESIKPMIDVIQRAVERMGVLLDDFMLNSTQGILARRRQSVDLAAVTARIVDEIAVSAPESRITLDVFGDTNGQCDPPRIEQAISNLLRNAVEHGDVSKPIRVRVSQVRDAISVEVHNDGTPIPADRIDVIFERSVRLETNDGETQNHYGLGLFIAKEIVDSHGGTIGVTSGQDIGTTFRITLPRTGSK